VRAVQIAELTGPAGLRLVDAPEPAGKHPLAPGGDVVIVDVQAAGVSFPEVLQSRGAYQLKPELPFIPGSEVAGTVRSAPASSALEPGERVVAMCMLGAFAETAAAPASLTFRLDNALDVAQGAGLILNYHTAYFSLVTRGRLEPGETVLVHGAAGGVGTATLQVARGLGARTFAVVSGDAKEEVARRAGADEVFRSGARWKDAVRAAGGVDLVVDPVGGDRMLDSLRCLNEGGRLVVVGFTAGTIPEVKVNRLLLNNVAVVGAGWGAYTLSKPRLGAEIQAAIDDLIATGHVRPIVGARFPLERAAEALELIDARRAVGKVVLDIAPGR
jgi:NADPH2:quinone reductase